MTKVSNVIAQISYFPSKTFLVLRGSELNDILLESYEHVYH